MIFFTMLQNLKILMLKNEEIYRKIFDIIFFYYALIIYINKFYFLFLYIITITFS